MLTKLKLIDVSNDYEQQCKIITMMRDEKCISEVFQNRVDRLVNSAFCYIIRRNGKDIGFVNLVIEKQDPEFYFLDIGLKDIYRNMGIGTTILKKLQDMEFDKFILLEVKIANEGANLSIEKVGIKVAEFDDINYYLLQKDKVEEFIDGDYLEELAHHVAIKSKKDLLKK